MVYAVDQVNTFAQQIASINQQIGHVEFDGTHANDLRDQRDLLLDQLSQFAKISYVESPGGMVSVYLGGRQLVDRDVANALTTAVPGGQTWTQIQWKSDGQAASITDGTIKGMLDSRDTILQGRMNDLDVLATRVVNSVNSVHSSGVGLDGVGGRNFFVGTGAGDMAVDSALTGPGGAEKVAAARMYPDTTSSTGYSFARGDSSNAVALAQLESTITQASTSSGLQPGTNLGGVTILGVDLARNLAHNLPFHLLWHILGHPLQRRRNHHHDVLDQPRDKVCHWAKVIIFGRPQFGEPARQSFYSRPVLRRNRRP